MRRTFPRLSFLVAGASVALTVAVLGANPALAQTAQKFSLQVSGLGSVPFGGGLASVGLGPGAEAQIRYNPSAFSVGFGVDITFHTIDQTNRDVTLTGGFIEPRYVIYVGNDRMAPYVSARGAVSQTKVEDGTNTGTATGFTLNGGGGLLFVLNSRTNIDVGATLGFKDLGETDFAGQRFDLGTGANLILRLGIAFGLGG